MLLEKSEEITPERMKRQRKEKQHPFVDVTGNGTKVRCYKEQYCIGTWNVVYEPRQNGSGQTGDGKSER